MIKLVFAFFFGIMNLTVSAQSDSVSHVVDSCECGMDNLILDFVEEMPQPVQGWAQWHSQVANNISLSDSVLKKGPYTIYVVIVVNQNGEICRTRIHKGHPDSPEIDSEAIRLIMESGKWNAGKMNGRPVCVRMTVPIKICLK